MSGCIHETARSPRLRRRPLTEAYVRDPYCDFLLYHPFFHETFDVEYTNIGTIPLSLDILSVEIGIEEEHYFFNITTGGEHLHELLEEHRHQARFGAYIDKDFNGVSDVFLTTTTEPGLGLALSHNFEIMTETRYTIEDNSVVMYVPRELLGESFDWLVFSGYSPVEDAFHPTPVDHVFVVPEVDLVTPIRWPRVTEIWATHLSTQPCQITETGYHSCPLPGVTPTNVPHLLPGASPHQGVMIHRVMCGNRGHELWCISCCFARRPFNGSWQGWIARCPYPAGNNFFKHIVNPSTNALERVIHTVYDGPYAYPQDTDNDGYFDVMEHDYHYNTNQVTSCNIELDLNTKALKYKRCKIPQSPYTNSYQVPGSYGISGT